MRENALAFCERRKIALVLDGADNKKGVVACSAFIVVV
jgi:hypothetical protein